jgi:lipoate-protein ligase A
MIACRLFIDPPREGAWNMAIDEALLNDAADQGEASLRFYQWHEPTLSLGYFQAYRERDDHPASREAAVVRRLSGGGALLHDRELAYSLALPASHPLARQPASLYRAAHRAIIRALASCGIEAVLHGEVPAPDQPAGPIEEPFLCFARRTEADVFVKSTERGSMSKVVGSAQRRRRGAVLQHGAVLIDASPLAPELPGVAGLSQMAVTPESLAPELAETIAAALELQLFPTTLDPLLLQAAERLQRDKYGHSSWTRRR